MHRSPETNNSQTCHNSKKNVSCQENFLTCKNIHDGRISCSHNKNTYTAVVQPRENFQKYFAANEAQVEDETASETEEGRYHMHY